jgi:hypothetical protein
MGGIGIEGEGKGNTPGGYRAAWTDELWKKRLKVKIAKDKIDKGKFAKDKFANGFAKEMYLAVKILNNKGECIACCMNIPFHKKIGQPEHDPYF